MSQASAGGKQRCLRTGPDRFGWNVELDAFRGETPARVFELTGIEVPDGVPASWKPPAPMC
jgi:hypothetical protein